MSSEQEIASSLNEIWEKLHTKWSGEDSNAFYQQYILKMTETIEFFETTCSDLRAGAADFSKKLQLIEQSIDNK